jgi:hypothetical protein
MPCLCASATRSYCKSWWPYWELQGNIQKVVWIVCPKMGSKRWTQRNLLVHFLRAPRNSRSSFFFLSVGRLERLKFVIITKLDTVFSNCIHRSEVNVHEADLALFRVLELQNYRFRIQSTIQGCGYHRSDVTVMLIPSYKTVPASAFTTSRFPHDFGIKSEN